MAATTVAELQSVADIRKTLYKLLELARHIKPETTIDPPLPVPDLVEPISKLFDNVDPRINDQLKRNLTIEAAAKEIFYLLVDKFGLEDAEFVDVWNLIDIAAICSDHGQAAPELAGYLIEELLDSQTTVGCRTVFDYLESRRERLAGNDFSKKHVVYLRMCNELLRRLSRAEDAIFCGRVFFFLFQTFPLGDKSSVNLRGEFHTDNMTKFEVSNEPEQNGEKMDVDMPKPDEPVSTPSGKATPARAGKKSTEEETLPNNELYPIFWRLQQDFCEPTRLFQADNFATFKKGLEATLRKFKATTTVVQTHAEQGQRGTKRKASDSQNGNEPQDSDKYADNYNPKYLTSRELFDLEISDLAFQRHIMVQALILIDFLLSLTEKAKKKLEELDTTKLNKTLLYSYTLSEEDTKWALATRSSITTYISNLHTDGRHYCRMIETVLARDKNWVRWKIENCPSIVREPVPIATELEARKNARDVTRPRRLPARQPPGTMDMSFLDEEGSGGGLEALKDPARFTAPTTQELIDGMETDKLDLDFAVGDEEEQIRAKIMNKRWRAMRQVRASDLALLDRVEPEGDISGLLKGEREKVEGEKGEEEVAVEAVVVENGDGGEKEEHVHEKKDGAEIVAVDGDGDTQIKDAVDGPEDVKESVEVPAEQAVGEEGAAEGKTGAAEE